MLSRVLLLISKWNPLKEWVQQPISLAGGDPAPAVGGFQQDLFSRQSGCGPLSAPEVKWKRSFCRTLNQSRLKSFQHKTPKIFFQKSCGEIVTPSHFPPVSLQYVQRRKTKVCEKIGKLVYKHVYIFDAGGVQLASSFPVPNAFLLFRLCVFQ